VGRDRLLIPDPQRRTTPIRDRPSPAFGERAKRVMNYVLRFWTCEKCGRPNKTAVALDGTVKCEQCGDLTRLRHLKGFRRGAGRLEQVAR
jgi:hypothetical protein